MSGNRYFLSVYGLAVKHGFQGTEEDFLRSLIGPQGPRGLQGLSGFSPQVQTGKIDGGYRISITYTDVNRDNELVTISFDVMDGKPPELDDTLTVPGMAADAAAVGAALKKKPTAAYVTPQMHGAVGDGVHDDTDAIRAARDAAIAEKKALFFPAGTYLVHGCIELWSDCEIYGEGSRTVIKKTPAYTEWLDSADTSVSFAVGQTAFTVADGSKYTVGHDFYLGINFENMEGVRGYIESIDGNKVTVATYPIDAVGGVLEYGVPSWLASALSRPLIKTVFSTSFPVFCSHRRKADGSWNVLHNVHIHDLTIDGNRQENEAKPYPLSTIHFDPLEGVANETTQVAANPNENIRIENLNVYNSPADGISIQSCKNVCITNCITENCGYNGVHLGVGTEIASVVGCKLNADFCGYFDCSGVNSVSLSNNHFEKCPTGIGGLDKMTRGLTVTGNTFRYCDVGIQAGATRNTDAMVEQSTSEVYAGTPNTGITICNNTFYGDDLTGVGISFTKGHYFTVNGNTFRDLARAMEMGDTSHVYISDNIIKDCAVVLAMGTNDGTGKMTSVETTDSAFVNNVIHAEADGTSAAVTIEHAENMRISGNIVTGTNAGISVDEATTSGIVEEEKIMEAINDKLEQMLQVASFRRVSGVHEVDSDKLASSVVWSDYEIPDCPAGAKVVVLSADQDVIDRITAEHNSGALGSGLYLVATRAVFNYTPVSDMDWPALTTVYQCATSSGTKIQKVSQIQAEADNSTGFKFQYVSLLKGKYYWTAYYWDE